MTAPRQVAFLLVAYPCADVCIESIGDGVDIDLNALPGPHRATLAVLASQEKP